MEINRVVFTAQLTPNLSPWFFQTEQCETPRLFWSTYEKASGMKARYASRFVQTSRISLTSQKINCYANGVIWYSHKQSLTTKAMMMNQNILFVFTENLAVIFSDEIWTDKSPLHDETILGLPGLLLVRFSMVHDGLCILFQEAKSVLRIQQRRLPASFAWYLMRGPRHLEFS